MMKRLHSVADLTNPEVLGEYTGPVLSVNAELLSGIGFSGSVLHRVGVLLQTGEKKNFILKQTRLGDDWLSLRSNDTIGRETAFLEEDRLAKIWSIIHCPYVAFAREKDLTGLLMNDLSDYLFPDTREPISITHEDIIVNTIASVHALFWGSAEIKRISWLTGPVDYLTMLGPAEHAQDKICAPPEKLRANMEEGWKLALHLLSPTVKEFLIKSAEEIFESSRDLPVTLLHGDLKIANMAILPGSKLALYDWPLMGCAPSAMELGWYLAVNATRLASTKEEFINKYRSALEWNLQYKIEEGEWKRMRNLATFTGAMMLLWNKALGWQSGTQKGKDEWEWWKKNLEEAVKFES